ncbi:MAG: aminotransferase class I/II-fold pyridoxal phosphate-dependent enzyme [Actinobacteria bacterium]|nr:aminotransferase class I/II-fold pyridoxal phosphate-dependent enzyme [Actinomycetota bacterium]
MSKFEIKPSQRLTRLPPYLFGRLNSLRDQKRAAGIDVIDLGMGNPMDAAPAKVVEKLCEAARNPANHRYSDAKGIADLRREAAQKYQRKWSVELDPDKEVLACVGSKEGLSHLCLAMLGPGDLIVLGEPAFPIHIHAASLAGAAVVCVPLGNDQDFLDRIQYALEHLQPRPKMMILNYPHNPTAITVDPGFFEAVVDLAKRLRVFVVHDFAYGETVFDGYKAPSFLSTPGAKDIGVEFTTLSKPYNMAGWRIGFAAGNAKVIEALAKIKGYYDYGIFQAVQIAAITAMGQGDEFVQKQSLIYQRRRDVLCDWLDKLGWEHERPRGSMFVWTKIAQEHLAGRGTVEFAMELMEHAEVCVAPGAGFGRLGEGYVRMALVENELRIEQAMQQIKLCLEGKPITR